MEADRAQKGMKGREAREVKARDQKQRQQKKRSNRKPMKSKELEERGYISSERKAWKDRGVDNERKRDESGGKDIRGTHGARRGARKQRG